MTRRETLVARSKSCSHWRPHRSQHRALACLCFKALLCCSSFPVLIVNLSILNHFNLTIKILVHPGLIEIFLFSNCFTYILQETRGRFKTGCVLSFCQTNSNQSRWLSLRLINSVWDYRLGPIDFWFGFVRLATPGKSTSNYGMNNYRYLSIELSISVLIDWTRAV